MYVDRKAAEGSALRSSIETFSFAIVQGGLVLVPLPSNSTPEELKSLKYFPFYVLSSMPLLQGLLDPAKTEVVITYDEKHLQVPALPPLLSE